MLKKMVAVTFTEYELDLHLIQISLSLIRNGANTLFWRLKKNNNK